MSFRPCIVIPTYNNPLTIRGVVEEARTVLADVIVVDDGGDEGAKAVLQRIEEDGLAQVVYRARNGGKGAAVKSGFTAARAAGFTHALQIDGDGQHDLDVLPEFLERARLSPTALVIAYPSYNETVPKHRLIARKFTNFWVNLEVGGEGIVYDAMVGVRVYPLDIVEQLPVRGNRMDFDVEIAVRYAWSGFPIQNLPVPVRYLAEEEGGVSHFRVFEDNLRFSLLHSRLCMTRMWLLLRRQLPQRQLR